MRTLAVRIAPLLLVLALTGCAKTPAPGPGAGRERGMRQARMRARPATARRPGPARAQAPPAGAFALTTAAFSNNAAIPKQYTADGQGISPPLNWGAPPAGTKSLALIVSDPDAPGGTYIHWVVYSVPAAARALPGSVAKSQTLPQLGGIRQGTNSAKTIGYTPPSPPPGKLHHYHFRLYALNAPVNLPAGATAAEVEKAMKGHVLATAELTGTYQR